MMWMISKVTKIFHFKKVSCSLKSGTKCWFLFFFKVLKFVEINQRHTALRVSMVSGYLEVDIS